MYISICSSYLGLRPRRSLLNICSYSDGTYALPLARNPDSGKKLCRCSEDFSETRLNTWSDIPIAVSVELQILYAMNSY